MAVIEKSTVKRFKPMMTEHIWCFVGAGSYVCRMHQPARSGNGGKRRSMFHAQHTCIGLRSCEGLDIDLLCIDRCNGQDRARAKVELDDNIRLNFSIGAGADRSSRLAGFRVSIASSRGRITFQPLLVMRRLAHSNITRPNVLERTWRASAGMYGLAISIPPPTP